MNIITKLSIRQKIMLTLTLLAAAFLVWQIVSFVRGDAVPRVAVQNNKPVQPVVATTASTATTATTAGVTPPPAVQPLLPTPAIPPIANQQREYLNLVRQYQVAKIKRQVLEEEASLALAQKRIADASKGHEFVGGGYVDAEVFAADSNYQLGYVDRQAGQWMAAINQGGQYKEVRVGSRLSNGLKVVTINANGVTLVDSHGKKSILTFQGMSNVDDKTDKAAVSQNKENKAKIAKMLGITATQPKQPAAAAPVVQTPAPAPSVTPPAKSSQDIPAAPLTATPSSVTPSAPATIFPTPEVIVPIPASPENTVNGESNPAVVPAPSQPQSAVVPQDQAAPIAVPSPETASPGAASPSTEESDENQQVIVPPQTQPAPEPISTAPSSHPVSVKELREHVRDNAQPKEEGLLAPPVALEASDNDSRSTNYTIPTVNQISLQEAAHLQAVVLNNQ